MIIQVLRRLARSTDGQTAVALVTLGVGSGVLAAFVTGDLAITSTTTAVLVCLVLLMLSAGLAVLAAGTLKLTREAVAKARQAAERPADGATGVEVLPNGLRAATGRLGGAKCSVWRDLPSGWIMTCALDRGHAGAHVGTGPDSKDWTW